MNTSTSNFLKGVIMKMTCVICGKEIYNSYISCLPVKKGMCCSCCYSAYGKFGDIYREDPHCADRRKIYVYLIQSWLEENN